MQMCGQFKWKQLVEVQVCSVRERHRRSKNTDSGKVNIDGFCYYLSFFYLGHYHYHSPSFGTAFPIIRKCKQEVRRFGKLVPASTLRQVLEFGVQSSSMISEQVYRYFSSIKHECSPTILSVSSHIDFRGEGGRHTHVLQAFRCWTRRFGQGYFLVQTWAGRAFGGSGPAVLTLCLVSFDHAWTLG